MKAKQIRKKEKNCLRKEPTWEHKVLSAADSIVYARSNQFYKQPLKMDVAS